MQDDPRVIHPRSEASLRETLTEIKQLGTDRVRVTVLWNLIAPNPRSEQRPSFDATDPRSYPPGVWDRYDRVVRIAAELDLGVLFTVSAPGPAWSDEGRRGRTGIRRPDARAFGDFVQAVGRRYSGQFPDPAGAPAPQEPGSPLPTLPGGPDPRARPGAGPAPARGPLVALQRAELPRLADAPVQPRPAGLPPPLPRPGGRRLGRPREVRPRRRHHPPGRDRAVRGAAEAEPVLLGLGDADASLRARDVLPVGPLPPVARARRPGARLPRDRRGPRAGSGPTTRGCSTRPAGPTTPTRSRASRPGRATGAPTP